MQLEIRELSLKYERLRIRDPAREAHLVSSMVRHGQLTAVLVSGKPGAYVLIDGYARVFALRELARDVVEGVELGLSEEESLLLCRKLAGTRTSSALEEGWWCRELIEEHGKTPAELACALDRSPSWVSRRLALVRTLPESVQDAVRRGALCAQAAQKYLVPLARANAQDCERLVLSLGEKGASVREMHELYVGWKGGTPQQRETLLADPRLYLKACSDRRPSEESPRLVKDLETVVGLCRRIRAHLRGGVLVQLPWRERRTFLESWREATLIFGSLREVMNKEGVDAGSADSNGDLAPPPGGTLDPFDREAGGCVAERGAFGDPHGLCTGSATRA